MTEFMDSRRSLSRTQYGARVGNDKLCIGFVGRASLSNEFEREGFRLTHLPALATREALQAGLLQESETDIQNWFPQVAEAT